MTIKIANDYPEFVITDTLHQLVDRLNHLTDLVDSNTRLFDSAVNTILSVVDSEGSGLLADSNLNLTALAGQIDITADSNIEMSAGDNLTLSAVNTITIDAGDKLLLNADSGEILLRSQGTQFGALKKDPAASELQIWTGQDLVLGFDATLDAEFAGSITMPSTGPTPNTTAKTVHGAINEVIQEHDSDHADHETRIGELETKAIALRTDADANTSAISNLDSDVNNLNLINIANRLATIEGQISQINNRLDILEIFT